MAAKLFHIGALVHFAYSLFYHMEYIAPHEMKLRGYTFGGSFVYLTILASVSKLIFYKSAKNLIGNLFLIFSYQCYQGGPSHLLDGRPTARFDRLSTVEKDSRLHFWDFELSTRP
jgi:hypothetical protein